MLRLKIFILMILLNACVPGSGDSVVPDDVIEYEKMKVIMTDIHLTEAWLKKQLSKKEARMIIRDSIYSLVFKKHDIDADKYEESLEFYLNNPHQFNQLYPDIIEMLSEAEARKRFENKGDNKSEIELSE